MNESYTDTSGNPKKIIVGCWKCNGSGKVDNPHLTNGLIPCPICQSRGFRVVEV